MKDWYMYYVKLTKLVSTKVRMIMVFVTHIKLFTVDAGYGETQNYTYVHRYSPSCPCCMTLFTDIILWNLFSSPRCLYEWCFSVNSFCIRLLNFCTNFFSCSAVYFSYFQALRYSCIIRYLKLKETQFRRVAAFSSSRVRAWSPNTTSSFDKGIGIICSKTCWTFNHIVSTNRQSNKIWYISSGILLHSGHGKSLLCQII